MPGTPDVNRAVVRFTFGWWWRSMPRGPGVKRSTVGGQLATGMAILLLPGVRIGGAHAPLEAGAPAGGRHGTFNGTECEASGPAVRCGSLRRWFVGLSGNGVGSADRGA